MFCVAGMTRYRALLDLLGIPYVGNRPEVMALAADKARAKAVVAAGGVAVPAGEVVGPGEPVPVPRLPAVVKPLDADNSLGALPGPRALGAAGRAGVRPRAFGERPDRGLRRARARGALRPDRSGGEPRAAVAGGVRGGRGAADPPRAGQDPPRRGRPDPGREGRAAGADRAPRGRGDGGRLGGGDPLPPRPRLPSPQPLRLPHRSRRTTLVPRGRALLLLRPAERDRGDGRRRRDRAASASSPTPCGTPWGLEARWSGDEGRGDRTARCPRLRPPAGAGRGGGGRGAAGPPRRARGPRLRRPEPRRRRLRRLPARVRPARLHQGGDARPRSARAERRSPTSVARPHRGAASTSTPATSASRPPTPPCARSRSRRREGRRCSRISTALSTRSPTTSPSVSRGGRSPTSSPGSRWRRATRSPPSTRSSAPIR